MTEAIDQTRRAEDLQAKILSYLASGDLDSLAAECFTKDARVHAFRFRADGPQAIRELFALHGKRLAGLSERRVTFFLAGADFIWQEVEIEGLDGQIVIYEFKFFRNDKVYLQLVGEKQGTLWQTDDFVGLTPPDVSEAERLHHRYIDYQARQDYDGMADDFFTADARLITAKLSVEGREPLRTFFAQKFAHEDNFHLVSMHNLTGDSDYIWFEATAASSAGARTVYDVMLLRDGKVSLQLVGVLGGVLPANTRS